MDVLGYFLGAAIRNIIVLAIFFVVIKLLKKPVSQFGARLSGIAMFFFMTILPMIFSGEVIINLLLGALLGYFTYAAAYRANLSTGERPK